MLLRVGACIERAEFFEAHITHQTLRAKITSATSGSFQGEFVKFPRFLLTRRFTGIRYVRTLENRLRMGRFNMSFLQEVLGIPDLGTDYCLTYGTNNDKTDNLVKGAGRGPLTKLKQADMFEDIFIW